VLATAGGDKDVRLWGVRRAPGSGEVEVDFRTGLSMHSRTVNSVRFSPDGRRLATAGDQGEVLLWHPVAAGPEGPGLDWKVGKVLRGHVDDVQDVAWAPDSTALVTGSIENRALVWDAGKGGVLARLEGHSHYVQGVAWDPLGEFVATQSGDRTCRLHAAAGGPAGKGGRRGGRKGAGAAGMPPAGAAAAAAGDLVCRNVLARGGKASAAAEPASPGAGGGAARPRAGQFIFGDENLPTFFRRLAWSPDGAFLAVPAGLAASRQSAGDYAAHVYARGAWSHPVLSLPTLAKPAVAVRFCPVFFDRDQGGPGAGAGAGAGEEGPFSELPYRMVFAAASLDAVAVYDTCSPEPLVVITGLHYAGITDLAWSPDGELLAISSSDGYCSFVSFEAGELGRPLADADLPEFVRERRELMRSGFVLPEGEVADAKSLGADATAATATAAAAATTAAQGGAGGGRTPDQGHEARAGPAPAAPGPEPVDGSTGAQPAKRRIVPVPVGTDGASPPAVKRRIVPVPVGGGESEGAPPVAAEAGPSSGGERRTTLAPLPAAEPAAAAAPPAPRAVVPVPGVREAPAAAPAPAPRGTTPPPVANLLRSFNEVSASKPAAEPRRECAPRAASPPPEPTLDLLMAQKPAAGRGDAGAGVPPGFL